MSAVMESMVTMLRQAVSVKVRLQLSAAELSFTDPLLQYVYCEESASR